GVLIYRNRPAVAGVSAWRTAWSDRILMRRGIHFFIWVQTRFECGVESIRKT
ncbi:MAG: hypothetical protein ACI9TH_003389, partial [Kiritimatiellia bacterium]